MLQRPKHEDLVLKHVIMKAFATICALGLIPGAPAYAAEEQAPFRDDFDRLDTERWYISDGWSNGDWMACTWSQDMVAVEEGALKLTLSTAPQGGDNSLCAEIQTHATYLYGTFEARMRTEAASGVNANIFTYIGPTHGESHNEIDVEILTRNTREVQFATHLEDRPTYSHVATLPDGETTDAEFHTYSFTWEPDRVRWYIDGVLANELTGADVPQVAQKIYLSHWNTTIMTDWMGEFVDPGRPLVLDVDWVAYTPLGTECQFEGSVLCAQGTGE